MYKAAPGDLQRTYDLLRKINDEEKPSKGLTEKLEQYQQLKQRVQSAADAFNHLNDRLEATKEDHEKASKNVGKSVTDLRRIAEKQLEIKNAQKDAALGADEATDLATQMENLKASEKSARQQYDESIIEGTRLKAQIKDMEKSQKQAAENKTLLDNEAARFEKKFQDDVMEYWRNVGDAFNQQRELTPVSKGMSIQDVVSEYKKSVNSELVAMDEMADNKDIGWFTRDSDLYKQKRKEMKKHLSASAIKKYRQNLINQAFEDAEQWNNANYAVLTGEELDPRIAASMQAKTIAERIAAQKRSFEEQFKGVTLDEGQQNRYNAIKKLLDSFNEED